MRLLLHWGLKSELDQAGILCPQIDFLEGGCPPSLFRSSAALIVIAGRTGDFMSKLVYHEQIMKELQADTISMHVRYHLPHHPHPIPLITLKFPQTVR